MSRGNGRIVYVGNLPGDIREREVEDLFSKYGRIRSIDLKIPPRPPAFAFIEFDDGRDAEDAVRGRNGYEFGKERLRVEVARGGSGAPVAVPISVRAGGRSPWRCVVKDLPLSASWQDLKDFVRNGSVKPAYTNVQRDRGRVIGVVEFDTEEDLKYAIRKLHSSVFKNPFDKATVRVYDDSDPRGRSPKRRSRSRSRSRDRRRSKSRSISRSRSRSRTRSRSRSASRSEKSASRSPSRSRSPRSDASPASDRGKSPSRSRSRSRSPEPSS